MFLILHKLLFALVFSLPTQAILLPPNESINYWAGNEFEVVNKGNTNEFIKIKTQGKGTPSFIGWELSKSYDMNRHFVEVFLKIDSDNWSGIELRLFNSKDMNSYAAIRVPKFTDPRFNYIQPGSWMKVSLTMGEAKIVGTPNLKSINLVTFYLNDSGSPEQSRSLEIQLSGVKLVPIRGEPMISITFDDGTEEHLKAAEIMAQYGLRGTAYVMPEEIGKPGFLREEDLQTLYKKYQWGISSHYATPFTDMSPALLQQKLEETLDFLAARGFGFSAPHMAFPLGKFNTDTVLPQVTQRFMTSRVAGGGAETFPPADWQRLRVVNITPAMTAEELEKRIEKAKLHNEWLILMFHHLVDGPSSQDLFYDINEFKKMMKVIQKSKVTTLPVHEVWESYRVD